MTPCLLYNCKAFAVYSQLGAAEGGITRTMARTVCEHCGLPVAASKAGDAERVYCCYGCYLVSRIVGPGEADSLQAWNVLRLGIGAFLAMDVMMISLLLYTGQVETAAVGVFRGIMLGLSLPAMLILGYPFILGALGEFRRRRLSLDALIALGSFTAFFVSGWNTLRGTGHIYFDTATMLPVLVTVGKLIEAAAKTRTSRLLRSLETLLPKTALRTGPQGDGEVALDALGAGDRVRVRPGERVAVDGVIVEGQTTLAEAAFTGEAHPRVGAPGAEVFAGTVNGEGSIVVEARRVGRELLLNRIIAMVAEAQQRSSPLERISEKLAAVFTPTVLVLAVAAGIVWLPAGFAAAGSVILAVLVVACPCAMGIATPLATALAIGRAARSGVLVRGGDTLEHVGALDVLFFDKTGTLTTGQLAVLRVDVLDPDRAPEEIVAWAASLETASEHVAAQGLVNYARQHGLALGTVSEVQVFPALGIRGRVCRGGVMRWVTVGSEAFLPLPAGTALVQEMGVAIHVAWDGRVRGRICLGDALRPEARQMIGQLSRLKVETALVSGDRVAVVRAVAKEVRIRHAEAALRPDQKIHALRSMAGPRKAVGMVGDGINDAPALAAVPVGIALGAGTDLARQAGNVVLLANDLSRIPWLIRLSRYTRTIVVQNLAWAFGYNAIALAVAALGLLHPLLAAGAMVVSSLTVLSNSLRIQRFSDMP